MAIIHDGNSVPISSTNPLPTSLVGSDVQVPVDIQSRYASTIQTHNAVSVAASSASASTFVDANGFDSISVTSKSDSSHTYNVQLVWSSDGVNQNHYEVLATGTQTYLGGTAPIRARYVRVTIANSDAVAHTVSSWAYLRA